MAHEVGHTGPYGELFEVSTEQGTIEEYEGDIDFKNPTSQDLAKIQQDPLLQRKYIESIMFGGDYFAGQEGVTTKGTGQFMDVKGEDVNVEDMVKDMLTVFLRRGEAGYTVDDSPFATYSTSTGPEYYLPGGTMEGFMNMSEEDMQNIFLGMGEYGATYGDAGSPFMDMSDKQKQVILGYFQDMQEGLGKLGSGDANFAALTRELGLVERGVTGPGGLTQQKGSMADVLQQKIGTRRQAYVPQEKTSRYGTLTGTGGGVDPTAGYLSGVGGDVSAYGTSITGIDKSIQDILTGTEAGSIHDVYEQYGKGVEESLYGPGGLWYV